VPREQRTAREPCQWTKPGCQLMVVAVGFYSFLAIFHPQSESVRRNGAMGTLPFQLWPYQGAVGKSAHGELELRTPCYCIVEVDTGWAERLTRSAITIRARAIQ
jgi:hypothetical protein